MSLTKISHKILYPDRIILLKLLWDKKKLSGEEIRDKLKLKDGFLWSHMRAFEQEGILSIEKILEGRRVYTIYSITKKGIKAYEDLRNSMMEFLKN